MRPETQKAVANAKDDLATQAINIVKHDLLKITKFLVQGDSRTNAYNDLGDRDGKHFSSIKDVIDNLDNIKASGRIANSPSANVKTADSYFKKNKTGFETLGEFSANARMAIEAIASMEKMEGFNKKDFEKLTGVNLKEFKENVSMLNNLNVVTKNQYLDSRLNVELAGSKGKPENVEKIVKKEIERLAKEMQKTDNIDPENTLPTQRKTAVESGKSNNRLSTILANEMGATKGLEGVLTTAPEGKEGKKSHVESLAERSGRPNTTSKSF